MKHKHSASLVATCVVQIVGYLLSVMLILVLLGYFIGSKLTLMYPSLEDLLDYRTDLELDEYDHIPLQNFRGCDFIIFDDQQEILYTSDESVSQDLHKEDLQFINDYYTNKIYSVHHYTGGAPGGTGMSLVLQHPGSTDSGTNDFSRYCVLDKDLNIITGDLFADLDRLTETEFDLISGSYQKQKTIQRYSYQTRSGSPRTLIFFSPFFDYDQYARNAASVERLWLIAIPAILVLILLQTLLFLRTIRRSLEPLNQAIVQYGQGKRVDFAPGSIPREFRYIMSNFDNLLDELDKSKQQTEQAYRDRQRIIADLSHDIRTPLTVMQGYTQALNDGVIPPQKQKRYLQVLYNCASSMAEQTEALQTYVQMDHPNYELKLEQVDFCEYCRTYLAQKYAEIDLKRFELDPDIPETAVPMDIDQKLFRRVFENVISNALKNNPAGTTLYFHLTAQEQQLTLCIADDGLGIPEAIRDRIFEPFVSGNDARTTGGGTGLGLSIARKIVELHKGTIVLKTPPDSPYSTEFVITLPRKAD